MSHAARYNHRTHRLDCECGETFADSNAHQRHIEERSPTTPVKHQITYHRTRATFRCSCGMFESESSFVTDQHLASQGLGPQSAAASAAAFDILPEIRPQPLEQRLPQVAIGSAPADKPKVWSSWINQGHELDAFMNGFAAGCAANPGPGGVNGAADAWQTYVQARIAHYGAASPGDIPPPPKVVAFDVKKLAIAIDEWADGIDKISAHSGEAIERNEFERTLAHFARHLATLIRESGSGS